MPTKSKVKPNPIFAIAADNWMNEVACMRKSSTYGLNKYRVQSLVDEFGYLKVGSITKVHLQKFIRKSSEKWGAESVSHHVTLFKKIMEHADEDWEIPRRLSMPKRRKVRQDYYTVEEMRKLIQSSSGSIKTLIMLFCETGLRLGEALALNKSDIKNNVLSINKNVYAGILQDTPKTDSSVREITLTDTLVQRISDMAEGILFQSPGGRYMWPQSLVNTLRGVCKVAGVEYKSPHAFRRGNITALYLTLKIPEKVIGLRTGHQSSSMLLGTYCQIEYGADAEYVPKIKEMLYG